jgi:hypothetical protein
MNSTARLASAAAVAGIALTLSAVSAVPASAASAHHQARHSEAVFVQSDDPAGNTVVAYSRAGDGTLTPAGVHPTGGLGGVLAGSVVDHLASQGSLTLDDDLLYAVNAGSDTITVFTARGTDLTRGQVVGSGGDFPVSIASTGKLVYVLNARSGGSVQGFRRIGQSLVPIPGSHRALGLDSTASPEFTHTPGHIAFTPDGSQLVVTTKANTNAVDVFGIDRLGRPSARPVVNTDTGAVPFAVSFDPRGHLVVAEAGTNALATFELSATGTTTLINRVATGQAATCWVVGIGRSFYASNAGSATLSGFRAHRDGTLTSLGLTGTGAGTVDAAASSDGKYLYVQTGAAGNVDEFRVAPNGSLTKLGTVTVPGAVGGEGIAAS